ncbi:AMP-binding protein [Actinotalea sp. AC32]|nr:AMP-binding protein [Actinotalea sp. AC32]
MSDGLHTLGRWVADRARLAPDHAAVVEDGVTTTYARLDDRAEQLARRLQRAGYRVGDRVATLTRSSTDHVVVLMACARTGLVLVPLSWRLAPEELAHQVRHCRAALLLVERAHVDRAHDAVLGLDAAPAVELLGADGVEQHVPGPARVDGAPPAATRADAPRRPVRDDDALLQIYTSGTSRAPKGVVLTHANCFWTNLSLNGVAPLGTDDVVLAVLPQFHVGGWNIQPLLAWWVGATVVLEREFDAGRALRRIREHRVTTLMGVPTTYRLMAEHPDFVTADLSSLRYAVVGGAPMPEELLRTFHGRGVRILQGYGLTEAGPNVLGLPAADAEKHVGSVGKPYPYVDVQVRDPLTGHVLHGAARGELLVRGPAVFAEYFRDPDATAAATVDGWLRTGDYVERDGDGYFRVVDRLGDMYISGGENISPAQVEHVLARHEAIAEAAVVGVPDARWGEVGHAYVVLAPGARLTADDVVAHCRAHLAAFKAPRHVSFVDALPRTTLDKLRRSALAPGRAPGTTPPTPGTAAPTLGSAS